MFGFSENCAGVVPLCFPLCRMCFLFPWFVPRRCFFKIISVYHWSWTKLILHNSMGFTELWKINFVQHCARQQLSFKNHAREKPETTEKQPNRHWRGTEDTPTVCTEAKERHGTHKKQKHMCNHQAIQEILNWVESSKLERILWNSCILFYLGENHLSSKPTMEVSALWWELIRKDRKPFFLRPANQP